MKPLFEWHRPRHNRYKATYVWWPISFGWVKNSSHAIITWHGWPLPDTPCNPDASPSVCGWTIHIGRFKIYFGKTHDSK